MVAIKRAPLEKRHRALMHEVHCPCVNRDMGSTERGDGGGRGIEANEMHRHIAVVFEGGCNRQACGEIATGRINKRVDVLSPVLFKDVVNGLAVEVGTADKAFELYAVCGFFGHGVIMFTPQNYIYK